MQLLSKEQAEIATFNNCEGSILVEAAAGSGKTRILTERVRYLLTKKPGVHFSVLCLTFTNKAAEEMKGRLRSVPRIRDRAFIGTFHEFCLGQILIKQKKELGFKEVPHIFDDNDKRKVLENIFLTNDIFSEDYVGLPPKEQQRRIDGFINIIGEAKRKLILDPDLQLSTWSEKRKRLYLEYNERMYNQSAMDYDDILLYAFRILTERPQIANLYRRRYEYILVDEAQDLNYSQYQILKAICGETHRNVMMVGDPNQAIYSFNGASKQYMQEFFVEDFQAKKLTIEKNYRSSDAVLHLANFLKPSTLIGDNNYFKGKCIIENLSDETEEAKYIIKVIKSWIKKGIYAEGEVSIPINLSDIAVIARNRYVFKELQAQLDQDSSLKDNYYLRQGGAAYTFESTFVKLFDLGLRIIVNPLDIVHFRQLCKEIRCKYSKDIDRIDFLMNLRKYSTNNHYSTKVLNIIVEAWRSTIHKPNSLSSVLREMQSEFINLALSDTEKLKTDYDVNQLSLKWKNFQRSTNPKRHNIANFRYYLALNNSNETENGLTLSTIHAAKGLEFEIVILMGMNEGVLPSYRAKDISQLEEEKNTAYVALTRAKKCIYVSYPNSRMMPWGDKKRQYVSRFIRDYSQQDTY